MLGWSVLPGGSDLSGAVRGADAVLAAVPPGVGEAVALRAALRLAGATGDSSPRVVLLADSLPGRGSPPWRVAPTAHLLARSDLLIVPDTATAALAARLGATSVRIGGGWPAVRGVEAAAHVPVEVDGDPPDGALLADTVDPVAVLLRREQARNVRRWAAGTGVPRGADVTSTWAAAGVLFALDLVDEIARNALVDAGAERRSLLRRWARAAGIEVQALTPAAEPGSVGVLARVHPNGCSAADIDEVVATAARVLLPGGVVVLTVPLGGPEVGGLDIAGLRALEARAHTQGLMPVGDLARALPRAADMSGRGGVHGLVRLTFRRR